MFSVQLLSHFRLFVTAWTTARQASLSISNFWSLLKLISIELGMPSNHLILCRPLLLLPLIFPSIRVFSSELAFFLYVPQNIDRHYVCFSAPFFFFQVKCRPVLLEVLHRMWFPDSSPLLILLCTSSHPVLLGYDESFMSVVLRVHHGVWTVRFCHHWVRLCCHQEYQPGGGTGWDTVKGRLAAIFIGICGYAPKASMRE